MAEWLTARGITQLSFSIAAAYAPESDPVIGTSRPIRHARRCLRWIQPSYIRRAISLKAYLRALLTDDELVGVS